MTLQEFLKAPSSKRRRTECPAKDATSSDVKYFFVAVDEAQPEITQILADALGLKVGGTLTFPCCLSATCPFRATTLQFAVGDTGSGSPMHFHQDAVNLLLAGRKRWWLRPPSLSAMSRLHPLEAQSCGVAEVERCYDGACVIEQEVGDVVYVPDMWGHAVVNLEPHTVCAATEFAWRGCTSAWPALKDKLLTCRCKYGGLGDTEMTSRSDIFDPPQPLYFSHATWHLNGWGFGGFGTGTVRTGGIQWDEEKRCSWCWPRAVLESRHDKAMRSSKW